MKTFGILLLICTLQTAVVSSPRKITKEKEYDFNRNKRSLADNDTVKIVDEVDISNNKFDGFENFIEGLGKLQDAIDNPDYDWQQKASNQSPDDASESGAESQSNLSDFFVLIDVMKQLVQMETTSPKPTSPAPVSEDDLQHLQEAEELLRNIISSYSDPKAGNDNPNPREPEGSEQSIDDTMSQITETFNKFFRDMNLPEYQPQNDPSGEHADVLSRSLAMLERATSNYIESFDGSQHLESLREVIGNLRSLTGAEVKPEPAPDAGIEAISNNSTWKLNEPCENSDQCAVNVEHSICGEELKCVCTEGFHISEIPTVGLTCVIDEMPPQPPVIDPKTPCTSPFEEIAYKMCILPEMEQRLSWRDAVTYCRSKGLELAYDSVVIKARRYFNNNLGESGSRERWPIWVGGKREVSEDGQNHWKWVDGTSVPDFLWTDSRPRSFKGQDNPEGVCMILDGFQAYYPDSLPCHNRRRFVCQRLA